MAAPKTYYARSNYQFLSGDRDGPVVTDSIFELDESDIWNVSASPELRKPVPTSRISKKSSSPASKRSEIGGTASSLPVNVPDWSKILKEDYRRRESENDYDEDGDFEQIVGGAGDRIPPHEFLARQMARTGVASFSVHEGIGRTLKGRDLSRVRNAIWEKTGFQD
ncbi:protein S40-4-like [Rutidosis leptorrhynchoides]|uniref:protein S40-4-like n=1 Tax=Rutidosis leptorrhynchoides TaxID=125765 RepID=UPI003A991BF9